jgi:DNA-binding CsgD family transcriptional regulator
MVSAGRSFGRALQDLKAAAGSTVADPALQGYFSIAYGQAATLAAPPAELPNLPDLIRAERSQLATTAAGLTQLAWRGTSLSLIGIQKIAIADLDIVISRLGDGIVDFGDGAFYAFQGLAYFLDGQWGRASISFDLARAGQSRYPAPLTSTMLPLAALINGDAERTRDALEEARRIRLQSPQPAAVNAGDIIEVFVLAFLGTRIEREQWLDRRTADFGDPTNGGPPGPMISFVAQSIAATWASRPDTARDWAYKLRTTPLAPWTDRAAQWLEARTEDDTFAERVEPLADAGLPEIPILDALINLELYQRSSGAVQRAARGRVERILVNFGGDRLLTALPTSDIAAKGAPSVAESPVLAPLSDREREIATLLLEGLSYAQIGRELFITRSTVSFHLTRIYAKTGTSSRHELAQITHHRMT